MKKSYLLLILMICLSPFAKAIDFNQNTHVNSDYDKCNGQVKFNVVVWDEAGDDDATEWFDVHYTDINGNDVIVQSWTGDDDPSGSATSKNGHTTAYSLSKNGDVTTLYGTWSSIPQNLIDRGSVEVRINGYYNGDGSDPEVSFDRRITINFNSITAPIGFSATTQTSCSGVDLAWSNPSVDCSGWTVEIWKYTPGSGYGSSANNSVASGTEFYTIAATAGITYRYKARIKWTPSHGLFSIYSNYSTEATGSIKTVPSPPSNIQASDDECSNRIVVTWNYNGINPTSFTVQRATNTAFTAGVTTSPAIDGGYRTWTDNNITAGATYYYRLRTTNECGTGSYSTLYDAGTSVGSLTAASNVNVSLVNNTAVLTWTDNTTLESGYKVVRSLLGGGGSNTFNLAANTLTYTDANITSCTDYVYEVSAYNTCNSTGTSSGMTSAVRLYPDLSGIFTSTSLTASKGYYNNRVELTWTNNSSNVVTLYKIFRKNLSTPTDSVQVASVNVGTNLYSDVTTVAGVLYEYSIIAQGLCGNTTISSNIAKAIGFRSPTGLINGNIEYTGGIALNGAKITAVASNGASGSSVSFSNSATSYLDVTHNASIQAATQLRLEAWVKPTSYSGDMTIASKGTSMDLSYKNASGNYEFTLNLGGTVKTASVSKSYLPVNSFSHIAVTYGSGDSLKVFVNGILRAKTFASGTITANVTNLRIGTSWNGLIDEFRYFTSITNSTINDDILRDYNRYLNGTETGIKIYCRFDENVGGYGYDISTTGPTYNANHARQNNVSWSTTIPAEVGYIGYTNSLGNFTISGIKYGLNGENYILTPSYGTVSSGAHTFSPTSRSLFIGDLTNIYNGQDFLDNSSFSVSGFANYSYKTYSCPVPEATIKIDGQQVVQNGEIIKTDVDGAFSIRVPIGNHYISIEKAGHVWKAGRYPSTGTINFQSDKANLSFIDTTYKKVVGRVVGGTVELNKVPGMGRSKNNIGRAMIIVESPFPGTACIYDTVYTSATTGEYVMNLPPLKYHIKEVKVLSNPNSGIINSSTLSYAKNIDLSTVLNTKKIIDTLYDAQGAFVKVDSIEYALRHDFVYRSAAIVDVRTVTDSLFFGERNLKIQSTTIDTRPRLVAGALGDWGTLGWPVFKQNQQYHAKIMGYELYTNSDNNKKDTVKLEGKVIINNQLVDGTDPFGTIDIKKGLAYYHFTCGAPNNTDNPTFPLKSYTKSFQVTLAPTGNTSVAWKPNSILDQYYYAYILGAKSTGTGFATLGPEKVDFILRDPPGSGSSATWAKGTSHSSTDTYTYDNSLSEGISTQIMVGAKFSVGLGASTETDIRNNITIGVNSTQHWNKDNSLTTVTTNTSTISTSSDPGQVGSPADIFYGKSINWILGPTNVIELIDTAKCSSGVICFGNQSNGYKLGKTKGFFLVPGDIATKFAYTTKEIEETVIPALAYIRNNYLLNSPKYLNKVTNLEDKKFGSNNDDPIWGTAAKPFPKITLYTDDDDGSSYTFKRATLAIADSLKPYAADSVRILNQQIRLWKEALAKNEKEKLEAKAKPGSQAVTNYSIGMASVTNTLETSQEDAESDAFEISVDASVAGQIGGTVGGSGVFVNPNIAFNHTKNHSTASSTETSTVLEYTLTDGDDGDLISTDVYNPGSGNGHIFVRRGGQTMCPYEGAEIAHYYDPQHPDDIYSTTYFDNGVEIAPASIQRQVPEIFVTPNIQFNVPANQAGVFQLSLSNGSTLTVNNNVDMALRIDGSHNPFGAIVKLDGLDPNRTLTIPSGSTVIKTLTVERGPVEYDYDSLMVIFRSDCEDAIADTAYISVHFVPTCTDLNVQQPSNNWVLNSANKDTMDIVIDNYNYNFGVATGSQGQMLGLNKIELQYRPLNTSSWLPLETFYKQATGVQKSIPVGQPFIAYKWAANQDPDGQYEIRAVSGCVDNQGNFAYKSSTALSGIADRINPVPFGQPSPADGILSPNDEISIKFNETIDISSLNSKTFKITGVLNNTGLNDATSLQFDGVNDYIETPQGINLQTRPFTIEFFAQRLSLGEQTVISQGGDANGQIKVGFDANNKFYFSIGNEKVVSTLSQTDLTLFHHYAVTYNNTTEIAKLYVDGNIANTQLQLFTDYTGSGKLYAGRSSVAPYNNFNGNLHELRLWNKALDMAAHIYPRMRISLSGRESGLIGYWKMEEASGGIVRDVAKSRHGIINGASWQILPTGSSMSFNGSNGYMNIGSGDAAINQEMDMTFEFWFKGNSGTVQSLFSNGKGGGSDPDASLKWSIESDASGKILVKHNNTTFVATDNNFFDNNWHHLALVVERTSNITAFIDGNQQNSVVASFVKQFGGPYVTLGSRVDFLNAHDQYFAGSIDEFRLWNTARKIEQIRRDKQNRLQGNEYGLLLYVPFERYVDVMGVPSLVASPKDAIDSVGHAVTVSAGATLNFQNPGIKLQRPVASIAFNYTLNNDQIIITPTSSASSIENVTLDISCKNIYDMHGNKMQSPKTWIAYVDKNQVVWQDDETTLSKKVNQPMNFTAKILNTGGAQKNFTINNLPVWLSASPASGTILPNSQMTISFTVDQGVNIGEYEQDVQLLTDFNYPENLSVKLKVSATPPVWSVDPAAFENSMSIIGQLKIDGVISTDPEDKLVAFVNNQVRGVASLQYYEQYDKYFAFLDVYSNVISGENVEFKIWSASEGKVYDGVTPSIAFVPNTITGTINTPQLFVTDARIEEKIVLNKGWNWLSFNLLMKDSADVNRLLGGLHSVNGDILKNQTSYTDFSLTYGWTGSLSNSARGVKITDSYRIKVDRTDTLIVKGQSVDPTTRPVNIVQGWNWIGLISLRNLTVGEALATINPLPGDMIKGQTQFAVYDANLGWVGSLQNLKPNKGYMLKSSVNGTIIFPQSGQYMKKAVVDNEFTDARWPVSPQNYSENMSVIAKVNLCDDLLATDNFVLGIFAGTECRGLAKPTYLSANDGYVFFLTAFGNINGELLTYKVLNAATGVELNTQNSLVFASNTQLGSLSKPQQISSNEDIPCDVVLAVAKNAETDGISVYPVPTKDKVNIVLNLDNQSSVHVNIYGITGIKVYNSEEKTMDKGKTRISIDMGDESQFARGSYILEISVNNRKEYKRIIKL